MVYSVWNNLIKSYEIYESSSSPIPKFQNFHSLGATPQDSIPSLPPGSSRIGMSSVALGTIVDGQNGLAISQFFKYTMLAFGVWFFFKLVK